MALLTPYIGKAVEDYYGQPLSVDLWANKYIKAKQCPFRNAQKAWVLPGAA